MSIFEWLDNRNKRKYLYKQIKHYRNELDGLTLAFGTYSKKDKLEMITALVSSKKEIENKINELEGILKKL